MNKRNLSVILVFALGIIFQTTFAFAQDTLKSNSSEEFIALKKGNYAIYLEFGSLIFHTDNNNSSNYDFYLTAKYHLSDKTALRITGGTSITDESGTYNRFENGDHNTWNYGGNISTFNTTVNIQHFLSLKSKVKPFYSLGVYARYYFDINSTAGYWRRNEEWGIGPFASFGAEMFVLDNVSIIGEYILKGTAGRRYYKNLTIDSNNNITNEDYEYSTVYKLDLRSFRAGLSIYF